jgi:hypothetical protein
VQEDHGDPLALLLAGQRDAAGVDRDLRHARESGSARISSEG